MSVLTNSSSSAHQKASNDDMGPFSLNPLATPEVMEAMRKQSTNGDSGRSNGSANANGGTKGPSSSLSTPPPPPSFSDENDTHCLVFVKSSFGTVHYADLLSRAQSWLIDTLGANYYLNTRLYFHAHFNSGSQCKAAYHRARTEGGSTTKPVGNYCSLSSCGKSRVNTSEKAVEAGIESNQLRRWVLAYKPQVIDQKGSIKNKSDHTDTLEELKSALVNSVEKRRKQSDTNHNNASNGNTTAVTASFPLPSPITRPLKLSGVTSSSASSSSSSSPGSASPSLPSSARSMIRPLRYSVKSKEGYSEHYPNKVNQDRAFICEGFNGEEHHYFFGVMDGHGEWGHHISSFVQEKYPKYLSCEKKLLKEGKIGAALVAAVKKMTDELSDTRSINSAFSGSTACAMLKIDNHMHLANIGDSRAIMGRLNPATSTIEGIALTTDHKPDHPAEKARIEGAGGRVCALTEGGIVRVWLKHVDEPGLAMSRSIGDEVSATVGVISTPEISTIPLTANDQFIVMASDGVWEFLSNQEVADIVWKHRDAIEDAVRELIDAAFHRWQQESPESVDDITAIVAFLK